MNSADWNKKPLPIAAPACTASRRLFKACGSVVLGVLLAGCAAQPTADGIADANEHVTAEAVAKLPQSLQAPPPSDALVAQTPLAEESPPPALLRPNWPARTWSVPPAAVEVNRGSVTPYPGEPESGEGVTAYGAGLRPPADQRASKKRDDDDDGDVDDVDSDAAGVLVDKGLASWYGGQFHGRLTANGERFDRDDMTAAHRSLPFGSKLCVRNVSTGKSVMVRINDRGPFAPGRVIDLSQAAAQELGIQGLGIKQVELWKLHKGRDTCPDELQLADARNAGFGKHSGSRVPITEVSASAAVSTRASGKSSGHGTRHAKSQAAAGKSVVNASVKTSAKASSKAFAKAARKR